MNQSIALVWCALLLPGSVVAQDVPSREQQVATAVQAAPEDRRSGATVLGYDAKGAVVTLREGTNDLVCLADNPATQGLSIACYHKDLEPFMARGRQLRAEGVTDEKVRKERRLKDVEAGKIPMPKQPSVLYVLTGKAIDPATNAVVDPFLRWVIYVPYATAASTGLSTKAVVGGPWLMDAGTAGAHIMVTPAPPHKP
jgi:hypothetical protein